MQTVDTTNRRGFLKIAALTSGGLVLGFNWSKTQAATALSETDIAALSGAEFNSYLSINPQGVITILSPNPEVGQGIKTAFPIVVAEELDADWTKIIVEQAPLDTKKFERQVAGGSGSIPHSWTRLRTAGATARQMLMEAAAKRWNVPVADCTTDKGFVLHAGSNRKLSYGELATDASQQAIPTNVKLKEVKDFKLIGSSIRNVDNPKITTGKPLFGLDFYREGMLFAMLQRPAFGYKLKAVDSAAAKAMSGIVDVVTFDNNVAVVGKSTWQVKKAKDALKIEWEKADTLESSSDHDRILKELLDSTNATVRRKDGDVEAAFKSAAKVVKSEYQCPFLSHAPLEPMNFFAHVRPDGVELVGPTQTPELARNETAKLLGISPDKVTVQLTRMGGGFGRRLKADYVVEAVQVSRMMKAPVKLIWTREDDMTGEAIVRRFATGLKLPSTLRAT